MGSRGPRPSGREQEDLAPSSSGTKEKDTSGKSGLDEHSSVAYHSRFETSSFCSL